MKKGAVSLKYNDAGSLLAVACADKRCLIVDPRTGNTLTTLEGEHALGLNDCAWLCEGFVVTASDDKTVRVWDVEAGKVVSTCHGHKSFVYCMNVHRDTRLIYTGGYDGSVRVFHAASSSCVMNFSAHAGAVVSLHLSPRQGLEYVTGSHDGVTRIWDAATPACCKKSIFCDGMPGVSGVRYSPNGDYILVSTLDSRVNLYPVYGTAPKLGAGAVKAYAGHVNARFSLQSAFFTSPEGPKLVLQGSEDGLVYVWDATKMAVAQTLQGHQDVPLAVACNPDESLQQIASAGRDGQVKLWQYRP